jgi:hypothetical protein
VNKDDDGAGAGVARDVEKWRAGSTLPDQSVKPPHDGMI